MTIWMIVPTIIALREKLNAISETELAKTLSSLNHLSDQDRQALAE